jgi:hypothetical protein
MLSGVLADLRAEGVTANSWLTRNKFHIERKNHRQIEKYSSYYADSDGKKARFV